MATEDELEAQLTALKKARASGRKRVTYGEFTTEYRDVGEINAAIAAVEKELGEVQGVPIVRGFAVTSCKGL